MQSHWKTMVRWSATVSPALIFLGGHLLGLQLGLCVGRSAWLVGFAGAMLLAALVGLALHRVARRDGRMRLAWGSIGATVTTVLVVGATVPAVQRARVGACALRDEELLRWIVRDRQEAIPEKRAWPSLLSILVEADDPGEHFRSHCSCHSVEEIKIGRFSLSDFTQGRVSRSELETEAAVADAAHPGWERVGYFVVCSDRATVLDWFGDAPILAYTTPLRCTDWLPMCVVLGDRTVHAIETEADLAIIESANGRARARGLEIPPDDVAGHARRLLGL